MKSLAALRRHSASTRFFRLFCVAVLETPIILLGLGLVGFFLLDGGLAPWDLLNIFYGGHPGVLAYVLFTHVVVSIFVARFKGRQPGWMVIALLELVMLLVSLPIFVIGFFFES